MRRTGPEPADAYGHPTGGTYTLEIIAHTPGKHRSAANCPPQRAAHPHETAPASSGSKTKFTRSHKTAKQTSPPSPPPPRYPDDITHALPPCHNRAHHRTTATNAFHRHFKRCEDEDEEDWPGAGGRLQAPTRGHVYSRCGAGRSRCPRPKHPRPSRRPEHSRGRARGWSAFWRPPSGAHR